LPNVCGIFFYNTLALKCELFSVFVEREVCEAPGPAA